MAQLLLYLSLILVVFVPIFVDIVLILVVVFIFLLYFSLCLYYYYCMLRLTLLSMVFVSIYLNCECPPISIVFVYIFIAFVTTEYTVCCGVSILVDLYSYMIFFSKCCVCPRSIFLLFSSLYMSVVCCGFPINAVFPLFLLVFFLFT